LFRGLLLAEFVTGSLKENFFRGHNLAGLKIVDPFMGGGTPLVEANRVGCNIIGYDINPMAYWIVRQEIEHLDVKAYLKAAAALRQELENEVGIYYRTKCTKCGSQQAQVKYFLWVKTLRCDRCEHTFDLFPGYVLAENRRHPAHVIICSACGELNETEDLKSLQPCRTCGGQLRSSGVARKNRCACPNCGKINSYQRPSGGPPTHRMVAMEYFCPACKPSHVGRFFKAPEAEDLAKYTSASDRWVAMKPRYVPEDAIPRGDETDRLHRWGRVIVEQGREEQAVHGHGAPVFPGQAIFEGL
jgi:adenine-specific DNA methylase